MKSIFLSLVLLFVSSPSFAQLCPGITAEISCVGVPTSNHGKPLMGLPADTACHDEDGDAVFTCGTRTDVPVGEVECSGALQDSGCKEIDTSRTFFGCLSSVPKVYSCSVYRQVFPLEEPMTWQVRASEVDCLGWYAKHSFLELRKLCDLNAPSFPLTRPDSVCQTASLTVACSTPHP